MELKQLDLSAPLLSVRRLSPILAASDGVNSISKASPMKQSLPLYEPDSELGPLTKPVAVPFQWERIPGRPKEDCKVQPHCSGELSNTQRLPPGRSLNVERNVSGERSNDWNSVKYQTKLPSSNDYSLLLEILKEGFHENGNPDSRTVDSEHYDFFERLSHTESCFSSFSSSGLSSNDSSEMKSSGTFSADPQTQEFIMRRFLPAAKALILEMPQSSPKQQTVENQHDEQYESTVLSQYGQFEADNQKEFDYTYENSTSSYGFLPRLRVRNSSDHLFNPVPNMKPKMLSPVASTGGIRRLNRTAYSGPLVMQASDVTQKKFHSGFLSGELCQVHAKKSEYMHSPSMNSRTGRISPYRNEAPPSPFRDGARFLGLPKVIDNVKADNLNTIKKGSAKFHVKERTLLVDSVNNSQNTSPCSDEKEIREDLKVNSRQSLKSAAAPPPIPKSPTESWLWRGLSSINIRNPRSHSKKQNQKSSNTSSKWETIVKASNKHHDHMRCSQELIQHVSQHSTVHW